MLGNRVLVTGGSGFLGTRLKLERPDWSYVSSKDYDLTSSTEAAKMFSDIKPLAVVHLAALVGGIKQNSLNQADFFYENVEINTHVLRQASLSGVNRVLSSLATCAYPRDCKHYPFDEKSFLAGAPEETNLAFAYAKRALYVQSICCRKQNNVNYSCFSPSNLYGVGDNFDLESSHFVSSMVRKIFEAENGEQIEFWGTGRPLRQQLYVDDLVKIIPLLLEKHNSELPLIIAPNENLSIKEMIDMCLGVSNKDIRIKFNGKFEGQYRKDGDNKELLKLIGDFKFTTFKQGIKKTYEWYEQKS